MNTLLAADGSLHKVLVDVFPLQSHLPDLSSAEAYAPRVMAVLINSLLLHSPSWEAQDHKLLYQWGKFMDTNTNNEKKNHIEALSNRFQKGPNGSDSCSTQA